MASNVSALVKFITQKAKQAGKKIASGEATESIKKIGQIAKDNPHVIAGGAITGLAAGVGAKMGVDRELRKGA